MRPDAPDSLRFIGQEYKAGNGPPGKRAFRDHFSRMPQFLRKAPLALFLTVSSCAGGAAGPTALPVTGTSVFGPQGFVGAVAGQSAGIAIVNPVGGGPPRTLVPNGNGTATIFQPGGPPIVIPSPSR